MPVANDKNEKDIKTPSEGTQGGQSAPKRKLNVVFRKQNSTSIKELPKRLKSAADGSSVRAKADMGAEGQGAQRRPRPLPAGTKPVRPAMQSIKEDMQSEKLQEKAEAVKAEDIKIKEAKAEAAEAKASEAKAQKAEAEKAEAGKAEAGKAEATKAEAEKAAAAETSAADSAADAAKEKTADAADITSENVSKSADSAKDSENAAEKSDKSAEKSDKSTEKSDKSEEKADKTAEKTSADAEKKNVSDGIRTSLSDAAVPRVKIVKSYANYDAAAVIAEASRQARQERSQQNQNGRSGGQFGQAQRRPRPNGAQGAGAQGGRNQADGQKTGGRTFISRGNAAPGQRGAAPGRAGVRPGQGAGTQGGRMAQGGASFDGSSKNQNGRNARNNYGSKDKRNDRKDKYVDDLSAAGKTKTGKGAFIKPEPKAEKPEDEIKVITIPETLTIKDLADKLRLQPSVIVKKLFLAGKMVTPNTDLAYEEAEEIAMEYDILCEKEEEVDVIAEILKEDDEDPNKLKTRNPVVCVMGHVDHGKTSLLDAIRNTNVTSREAGGITQHIGASVVKAGDRCITFLDTPGHEAFTAMRLRGAQSTDIAVLVVAADDGVKPQTVEAINHAKAAGVEVIVAINKMDKPAANPDMVRNELSEYGLISEDWGGSTPMVPVSAKTGEGIPELLDMILLEADVLELKANPNRNARGLVIEAQLDKGRGPVATVLVQKGTLNVGDNVVAGACYGKVRAMLDDKHASVKKVPPSYPAEILGLNDVPNAGEVFMVCKDEKEARSIAETFIAEQKKHMLEETKKKMNLDDLFDEIKAGNIKELPIIVKADVQGSVEAVKQSLGKLSNEEVAVKVIHAAAGNINESDVNLASAANAIIIGFNVKPDATAKSKAEQEKIDMRLYKVIYQAIEDLEAALTGMLAPVYEPQNTGRAIVRQIFKSSGVGIIAGSYVTDGVVERGSKVRLFRGDKMIFDGDIASLKRFKDEVKEVKTGFECGIVLEDFTDIAVDDTMEIYKLVQVPRS